MRMVRLGAALVSLVMVAGGCTCDRPKFSCSSDLQCPETYSCVAGVCDPCPVCGAGERCAAGACVPALKPRLAFTTPAQTLEAGACSAVTQIEAQDSAGLPAVLAAELPIALGSTSTTLGFFSDSACASPLTEVSVASGASSASVFFKDNTAGAPELTGSNPGYDPARQLATILAGAVSRLAITSPPQTLGAGACSSAVTVAAQDPLGNPAPPAADASLALTSSSTTLGFFADASCATAVTSLTLSAGAATQSFFFRDTSVGNPQLTVTASFGAASQSETILPGGATGLGFSTPSRTVAAGACSPILTLQSQDALGNPAVSIAGLAIALSSTSGTMVFHSDPACTTPVTMVAISAGGSSASFYFTDTVAGTPSLTGTSTTGAVTPATQSQTIAASTPVSIAFATPSQTLTAGDCSAANRIEARDGSGNPSPVIALTPLTLSANAGTLGFYSDPACGTSVTAVDIPSGATGATFYFRDTAAGARTLTVDSANLGSTSQAQTINVATGRLAITTAPQTRAAGACSGLVTVQSQTSAGAPLSVTAPTVIGLTSSSATMAFFTDPACATATTTVTIAIGTSSEGFYFRDSTLGGPTLTVSASGFNSAQQAQTITAGAPSQLAFITAQQSRAVGSCSQPVTVQARDAFDNPAPVVGITPLTLASTSGTMTFFSDPACATGISGLTLDAGASTASLYFKDTAAGSPTITVAGTGLGSANQTETIVASGATQLAYSTPARTEVAGACSAIVTVQAQDGFGNPAPVAASTAVALSSGSATLQFFSDPACATAITALNLAAGASTASFYFKDPTAGSATTTATAAALGAVVQTQVLTAGPATKLVFTTAAQTTTDISCSAVVGLQAQDTNSNPATLAASTPVNLTSSSATMGFYSDPACGAPVTGVTIAAAGGTAQFYFRDSTAGTPTLTATAAGLTAAVQTQTVSVVTKKLVFLTPLQVLAAGACSAIVSVQSQTAASAPLTVSGLTPLTLLDSTGTAGLFSDSGCTVALGSLSLAAGTHTASFYFRQTRAGPLTFSVSAAGYAGASQVETIQAGPVSHLGFASAPVTAAVNTCSAMVTIQSQDQYGNYVKVSGSTSVSVSSGSATMGLFSNSGCTTALGSFNFTGGNSTGQLYFKDTRVGSPILTVSGGSLTAGTQAETITPGAPVRLVFSTAPQTVVAGACSAITTVGLQDSFSNPAPAASPAVVNLLSSSATTAFFSNPGCTTPASNLTIAAGASSGSFYFRDNRALGLTVTVSSAGLTSANQAQSVVPGPPAKLVFTTPGQTVVAGSCSTSASLQTQDALNNPANVAGALVAGLTPSTGTMTLYADPGCVTAVGSVTFAAGTNLKSFYFRETRAGTTTITASATGLTPIGQPETINPAPPSKLVFTTAPQVVLENFCSAASALQTQDAFSNASGVTVATSVGLSSGSPTLTFYSNPSCTTAIGALPLAIGASAGSFYFKDTTVGTPTVTATAGGLGSVNQVQTVDPAVPTKLAFITPARTAAAGACSEVLTLQSQNANSLPSNVVSNVTVNLGGSSFYSDPGCTASVTSAVIPLGSSSASFYFRSTTTGSATLTASSASLTGTSQGATITAGPASALVFLNPPISVVAGVCSTAANLRVKDAFNNDATVTANTTVGLGASPATLTFFTDPACNTATTSLVIATGSGTQSFYFRSDTAGSSTVSATATGLTAASQVEQVNPAAPAVLAFTSPAQSLVAGACSAVATLRTRDALNNDSNVAANTTVTLAGGAISFYLDAGCTTQVTSVVVATGSSTAGFYFKSNLAGGPTITASATGFSPANQAQTISPAPPAKLVFTTTASAVLASACSAALTVQSQDPFDNPTLAGVTVDLSKGATAADLSTTFYSDPGCTAAVTSVAIAGGTSSSSFYFRTITGGAVSVTASGTGLTGATQGQTVRATSRSGTCSLGAGSSTTTCAIAPVLFNVSRTMMFFQSTTTGAAGGDANVRCALTGVGTIVCDRESTGGANVIQWHTVEFPANNPASPLVRHLTSGCGGALTTVNFSPALSSTNDSFVLFSSTRASNTAQTVASVRTARLAGLTQVAIEHNSGGCGADAFALQVVEYPGASVVSGTVPGLTTLSSVIGVAPSVDLSRTFLLATWRSGASLGCARAVRGSVSAAGQLTFARGAGNAACTGTIEELHYQRVELPAGNLVQPVTLSLAAGAATASAGIAAVDLTRSAAFSAGQVTSGQGWGESGYSTGELFGESEARQTLGASTVQVTRASTLGAAAFTTFVVQFQP